MVHGTSNIKSDQIVELKSVQEPDTVVAPGVAPKTESTTAQNDTVRVYVNWTGLDWTTVEMAMSK